MTNGILVILKNGKVILKVIVGCDGHDKNAWALARWIAEHGIRSLRDIDEAAQEIGFGCTDCRVILTAGGMYDTEHSDEVSDGYFDTFDEIAVNPRFPEPAPWSVVVLDVDANTIYRQHPSGIHSIIGLAPDKVDLPPTIELSVTVPGSAPGYRHTAYYEPDRGAIVVERERVVDGKAEHLSTSTMDPASCRAIMELYRRYPIEYILSQRKAKREQEEQQP